MNLCHVLLRDTHNNSRAKDRGGSAWQDLSHRRDVDGRRFSSIPFEDTRLIFVSSSFVLGCDLCIVFSCRLVSRLGRVAHRLCLTRNEWFVLKLERIFCCVALEYRYGLTSRAKAQAAALRIGVEKYRDDDNAVKVFELTLRNEVCMSSLLTLHKAGEGVSLARVKQDRARNYVIRSTNQVHDAPRHT